MTKKLLKITIVIPLHILEDKSLSKLQILILSVGYIFHQKLGFNALNNVDLSEMLGVNVNTLGKERKGLVSMGYEVIKDHKYYLTEKVEKMKSDRDSYKERTKEKREILLPHQIYSIKNLSAGAKLLWAEYNSLSKGDLGYCNASREYLAKRLNCNEDSISNWNKKLDALGTLSHNELKSGKNKRQMIVETRKFKEGEEFIVNDSLKKGAKNEVLKPDIKKKPEVWDKKEIVKPLEIKINKAPTVSIEHSDDEVYWRNYMRDVGDVNLDDEKEVEKFGWKISEQTYYRREEEQTVMKSILRQIDKKMGKRNGVMKLKSELSSYL